MADEKFTDLPVSTGANLTDIYCAVQGYSSPSVLGTSVQQTLQQNFNLYQQHVVITTTGNPNGFVVGILRQFCWDITNKIMYTCTVAGTATTTVWEKVIQLTAGEGVSITQNGNDIVIAASNTGPSWSVVTIASTSMITDFGYIVNYGGGQAQLILPTTSSQGDVLEIAGQSAGGWIISQNALQSVHIGTSVTTVGVAGSIASSHSTDSIRLVCITDDLEWTCLGAPQSSGLTII